MNNLNIWRIVDFRICGSPSILYLDTVYEFGYDDVGRRTSLLSSTGRASTYSYENGLLATLNHVQSGVSLTDLAYGYDVDGQLTSITDNLNPSASWAISV